MYRFDVSLCRITLSDHFVKLLCQIDLSDSLSDRFVRLLCLIALSAVKSPDGKCLDVKCPDVKCSDVKCGCQMSVCQMSLDVKWLDVKCPWMSNGGCQMSDFQSDVKCLAAALSDRFV